MILSDKKILDLHADTKGNFIKPFIPHKTGNPSYGLSSAGYDLRLGYKFLYPDEHDRRLLDPTNHDGSHFYPIDTQADGLDVFDIPAGGFVLASTLEHVNMPEDYVGHLWGKSTYARCGIIINATPIEPGWSGHITLEIHNTSPLLVRLHVGMGICQMVVSHIGPTLNPYGEGGKYQNQGADPVVSR